MTTFTEPLRVGDGLKREYDKLFNRETVNITGGASLPIFQVVGLIATASGSAVATADAGNTGNGTMGAITVGAGAIDGDYTLTITAEDADAGDFNVTDPNGAEVGTGTVGVEFDAGGLTFTLADGAEDFDVGDSFTIAVTTDQAGDYAAYDSGASDGRETAAGVLLEPADATGADVSATILARGPAVMARSVITGLDAAAETQLLALGIVIRDDLGGAPVFIS